MPPLVLPEPVRLRDEFPELVESLEKALREEGELDLATTVDRLRIYACCGCGDSFCLSFYTMPPRQGVAWDNTIGLESADRLSPDAVDLFDGAIAYVEIIWGDTDGGCKLKPRYRDLCRRASAAVEAKPLPA